MFEKLGSNDGEPENDFNNFAYKGEQDDNEDWGEDGDSDENSVSSDSSVKRINTTKSKSTKRKPTKKTLENILSQNKSDISREVKIINLVDVFGKYLPQVEGDKVTFIGSTFLTYGEKETILQSLCCSRHL